MRLIGAVILCLVIAIGMTAEASAQENVAKFIEGFNSVKVRIVESSAECGIEDSARYATALESNLSAAGLDPIAIPTAYLMIWGRAFGPLKQQCAIYSRLRLGADIAAGGIRIDVKLKSDATLIKRYKAVVGTFPTAFYVGSTLAVKLVPSAPDAVEEAIGLLAKAFETAHG